MSNDEKGFMKYPRKDPGYRLKEERLRDFKPVEIQLTEEDIHNQTARCMDCGTPFCHGCGCPLGNIVPEFNELVHKGRWQEALDILLSTNPFPEFTGRVCPALCEGSCVLGINDEPVTIRQVELAIVEAGFEKGFIRARSPGERLETRVAVIGSGPAGLAAAEVLNKAGYRVTVYEEGAQPGGILRYGIPDFKLDKQIVERRIRLMEEEGVVFETSVEMGRDISARFLKSRFEALVLAGGARQPRDLPFPGRELKGIHFAMDFLVQQNKRIAGEPIVASEEIAAQGKDVVILGGGDTGSDCLGTALRQGARRVYQFEILPEPPRERAESTPWPMWPLMRRDSSSHKEGGIRRWSVTTKEFLGKGEAVEGVRCAEVDWVREEESQHPVPREKPATEFSVEAQLVLLALGFTGPGKDLLVEDLGLARDNRGFIARDQQGRTSDPDTFTVGDMTQGPSLVVRAIDDGMQVAREVIAALESRKGA